MRFKNSGTQNRRAALTLSCASLTQLKPITQLFFCVALNTPLEITHIQEFITQLKKANLLNFWFFDLQDYITSILQDKGLSKRVNIYIYIYTIIKLLYL